MKAMDRVLLPAFLTAMVALAVFASGCSPAANTGGGEPANTSQLTPRQILDDTLAVYRTAPTYRDTVHLKLRYEVEGQALDDATDLSFGFDRKSRQFCMDLKRAKTALRVASDGRELQAQVAHPETGNFDSQVVFRPAPAEVTVGSIYSTTQYVDSQRPQQRMSFLEGTHLSLDDLPLALLVADKPLAHLAADDSKLARKLDEKLDGRDCFRLAFTTEGGDYVYWIDKATHLIRRIELPTGKLADDLIIRVPRAENATVPATPADAQAAVKNITFWAEIENPEIRPEIVIPSLPALAGAARRVEYFVYPPAPLPSKLIGKRIGQFAFTDLNDREVNQSAFAGKINVLLWWNNQGASRQAVSQLNAIANQLKDDARVQCFAICAEPEILNLGHIAAILHNWKITMPVLRDKKSVGRSVFQVQDAPTCIVIDGSGFVQLVEVGANPLLVHELPIVLNRLVNGDSLAAELLTRQAKEQEEYERQLAIAQGETPAETPLETEIPAATLPRQMRLTSQWKCDIPAAGNILCLDGPPGQARAYVLSEGRKVVAIDEAGKGSPPIDLGLPADQIVSFLRAGQMADGSFIYAAAAKEGPAVHLYDSQWRRFISYPAEGQTGDKVQQALLADLDGDKAAEIYVGFWGEVGLHRVALDGKTLWRNRTATPVLGLVPFSVPNEGSLLLVTSNRGLILPVNQRGKEGKAYQVGDHQIHTIAAARFPAPRAAGYLGGCFLADGGLQVVALDDGLREAWAYPLPPGTYRTPIEPLQSGRVLEGAGNGQWLVAGPDGSVHVLSDDGHFVDNYRTGKNLTGITAFGKLLLLATPEGVEAFAVSRASN